MADESQARKNLFPRRARLRINVYDKITGLIVSVDRFASPSLIPFKNGRGLVRAGDLASHGLGKLLTKAVFQANSTAAFALRSGNQKRIFLVLNDARPGFDARRDNLWEVTGFSGRWRTLAIAGSRALLPIVTLSVSPERIAEDAGGRLIYTFKRTGIIANRLSVNYIVSGSAAAGTDYVGLSAVGAMQSIAFRPGETTARLILHPVADRSVEGDETVVLVLVEAPGYVMGTPGPVTATIVNDDFPAAARNLSLNISIEDLSGALFPYHAKIEASIQIAGELWDYHIEGFDVDLDVVVRFSADIARATGRSLTSSYVGNNGVYDIYEQGAAAEIRTGIDPNGREHDIEIVLNPDYLIHELWFEPGSVFRAVPVPSDQTDAVSVFLHELGHAFAFNGWMNGFSGVMPGRYQSVYDELIDYRAGNFYFTGAGAEKAYGSAVPLTYGDITHLGNLFPGPGSDLIGDLMNGVMFQRGSRYNISPLNVAILADVGIPVAG